MIPPGAKERRVDTPSGNLRVLRAGSRRNGTLPLVLIHGGGSDNAAISWFNLFAPLAEDREIVAPDLPGFGGSVDVPAVGGPKAMADTVAQAMDALGVERAVVFGVSMGGDVALNLALEHPERVAGLVLVAPGGLVPVVRSRAVHFSAWLATKTPDWLLLPAARLANKFVSVALRAMVKDPKSLPPQIVAEFAREARHPRGGIAYGRYNQATIGRRGMLNDLSGRVHEIDAPALFFHGADDPLVDPEGSRRAAGLMPNARLVLVPDCGHWAQIEKHDLFLTEARAFLAGLAAPDHPNP